MDKEALLTIGRPQRLCVNCNSGLAEIERHPSTLRTSGRHKIERLDYCPDCWQHIKDETYESFWITRREMKEQRAPKLSRRERSLALRALFETMWDRREEEDLGAQLYLLSHLLMKWGGLKWRASQVDALGREVVVFEEAGTGEMIEIPAVTLDDQALAHATAEIENFLRQYAPDDTGEL